MAKAIVDSTHPGQFAHAADAILALINSRPRSPTREELIALLEEVQPAANYPTERLSQWRTLLAAHNAAWEAYEALGTGHPERPAKLAEAEAARAALRSFTKAHWAKPVTSWADVALSAEIAIQWCWPEDDEQAMMDFHRIIADRSDTGFDERAPAHLIRAVLDIAQQVEIAQAGEPPDALKLADEIRELRRIAVVEYDSDVPESEAAQKQAMARIEAIEKELWRTSPRRVEDLQPFAEIAYFHQDADCDDPHKMAALTRGFGEERIDLSAAHLIRAVLAVGGRHVA